MTIRKNSAKPAAEAKTVHHTKAFANWVIRDANGDVVLKSTKGFPIQGHPDYPNKSEDALINLATKNGGSVKVQMEVTINLNKDTTEVDLDAIPVVS